MTNFHNLRLSIVALILTISLACPAAEKVQPARPSRSWSKPCAIAMVTAISFWGGIRWTEGYLDLQVAKEVISRSKSETRILEAKTQAQVLSEAILLAYGSSTQYLATPRTVLDDVEDYLVKQKWIKPRYRTDKSVANHIFDYVDKYNRDPKVTALIQELKQLPYGKLTDEIWFDLGVRHLGEVIPEYHPEQGTYSGLSWEENLNLQAIYKRSRSGFTNDERQALVSYLLLEQHKYSGNRDLLHLLLYAPGFLEAVDEQPLNYADWISKAARHLKAGDQESAQTLGQAMRHVRTESVVAILKALGPSCFRVFMKESRHWNYADKVVSRDVETYRPILRTMLLSGDASEVETAKEICKQVPELANEIR